MAFVYDNKTYRNLQQQVKENMLDIARLQDSNILGLDIQGIVPTNKELPTAKQGDIYAVGTEAPFELYLYNDSSWVSLGQFPKAGPKGEQGPKGQDGNPGPRGLTGEQGPRGFTGAPGVPGQAGPKGEQGPQGIQGPEGPRGYKGDKGDPFVYSDFTAEQLEALRGPQGPIGLTGPKGDAGPIGPQGPKGDQGLKGDTGERGPIGPQGIQGVKGDTGATGPIGPQGERGPKGDQGIQGIQGPKGDVGPQGPKGDKGATGAAFTYDMFTQEQLEGLRGPQGIQGPKGDKGDTGAQGIQGIQGPKGDTGATGATGPKGDTGPQGPKGEQGIQGPQGPQGPKGADGLTTSVTVNGTTYTQSSGNITLPSLLNTSTFDDFIAEPFPYIDDVASYDRWTYFIGDELGFIDTPHPTYYLHTIRAYQSSSPMSSVVFSVISTQSTAYTKATLYNAFQNKVFHASGYCGSFVKADGRINYVYLASETTIKMYHGNNTGTSQTYGGTYFADEVKRIA